MNIFYIKNRLIEPYHIIDISNAYSTYLEKCTYGFYECAANAFACFEMLLINLALA